MRKRRINGELFRLPADDREALMAEMDGMSVRIQWHGQPVMLVPDKYNMHNDGDSEFPGSI